MASNIIIFLRPCKEDRVQLLIKSRKRNFGAFNARVPIYEDIAAAKLYSQYQCMNQDFLRYKQVIAKETEADT